VIVLELPTTALLTLAFGLALAVTLAATPLARRLAMATAFYDHPEGYKEHAQSTPYLGGVAVMAGLFAATLAFAPDVGGLAPVLGCVLAVHLLGTVDDRHPLGVTVRVVAEVGIGVLLWATGWGWAVFDAEAANLVLTVGWVVGIINAFNLMDNLDGAAGTVACVSGAGTAVLASLEGHVSLAVLAIALSGACAGFLRYNLARPARIFLGDGGSVPIGLLLATTIMAVPAEGQLGWVLLLVGVPIIDTTLVVLSRTQRGISVLVGGRDHLSHRLLAGVRSERNVALALGAAQAVLCAVAVFLTALHGYGELHGAFALALLGVAAMMVLRSSPETATAGDNLAAPPLAHRESPA
jgi:UDP-GlcNAc:undecaprenyl-phosphate/decaprenyl-phosphate GlcNAc-1-phosphate transferase